MVCSSGSLSRIACRISRSDGPARAAGVSAAYGSRSVIFIARAERRRSGRPQLFRLPLKAARPRGTVAGSVVVRFGRRSASRSALAPRTAPPSCSRKRVVRRHRVSLRRIAPCPSLHRHWYRRALALKVRDLGAPRRRFSMPMITVTTAAWRGSCRARTVACVPAMRGPRAKGGAVDHAAGQAASRRPTS